MDTPTLPTQKTKDTVDLFLVSAHELRTSLSAMKWMFAMLLSGDFGSLTIPQKDVITQATLSNERMISLVNHTMAAIRDESTSVPSDPYTRLSIPPLIEETIRDFTSEASHKGVHIRYTPTSDDIFILGNADKIRIIQHNLVENAIKYGDHDTDILIELKIDHKHVSLSVHDHGLVIPSDEKSFIFTKFFRTSNVSKIGLGIGLYATKQLVNDHRGMINFTSTRELGTTFTVRFPCLSTE